MKLTPVKGALVSGEPGQEGGLDGTTGVVFEGDVRDFHDDLAFVSKINLLSVKISSLCSRGKQPKYC